MENKKKTQEVLEVLSGLTIEEVRYVLLNCHHEVSELEKKAAKDVRIGSNEKIVSLEEDRDKLLQRVKRSDALSTIALIFTALCLVLKILIHVIVATA